MIGTKNIYSTTGGKKSLGTIEEDPYIISEDATIITLEEGKNYAGIYAYHVKYKNKMYSRTPVPE